MKGWEKRIEHSTPAVTAQCGYVYLMKSGKFYKRGRSNAAGRSQYELGIQLPEKLKTMHVIRIDEPAGTEGCDSTELLFKNDWCESCSSASILYKMR